jgi:cytochrome c oxidase subunit 3
VSTASATAESSASVPAPRKAVHRASPLTVGTIVFLASELMFFGGLFAVYFTLRALHVGPWPPEGNELEWWWRAIVFTGLLVASSGTMQVAVHKIAKNDKKGFQRWVAATVVLGILFLFNQFALEWPELRHHGMTPSSDAFGSLFFTMTGFHGAHVTGGILAMFVILARSGASRFGSEDLPTVEVVSYYWHFVDVVWVIMFGVLFFVK